MRQCLVVVMLFLSFLCYGASEEELVVRLVQEGFACSKPLRVQRLYGGYGGAKLFLVEQDRNAYVVKFLSATELYNTRVASDEGYGPHIYIQDAQRGFVIMEHLAAKAITMKDLESDVLYVMLAKLLKRIHTGKAFSGGRFHPFVQIEQRLLGPVPSYIPVEKIKKIVGVLKKTLARYVETVPCHNDLHLGNVFYLERECRAIDYGEAACGDPYFDLATVAATTSIFWKKQEQVLLRAYFGRELSEKEKAKFYLMKQVVLLKWICDRLKGPLVAMPSEYVQLKSPPTLEFFKEFLEGHLNLRMAQDNTKSLAAQLDYFFQKTESDEFAHAVRVLGG